MSTDTSAEASVDNPILVKARLDVKIADAVREYINAQEKFERIQTAYAESCQAIRDTVPPGTKIVVRVGYSKHYMLVRDEVGFTVEPVEVIMTSTGSLVVNANCLVAVETA